MKYILIVEDSLVWQSKIASYLNEYFLDELSVTFSHSGRIAQAIAENKQFDLVILDHDLPDGNGPTFLKWYRKNIALPGKVIAFSTSISNNEHLLSLGADEAVDKLLFATSRKLETLIRYLLNM